MNELRRVCCEKRVHFCNCAKEGDRPRRENSALRTAAHSSSVGPKIRTAFSTLLSSFRPSEIRCSVKLFELDTASLKAVVRRAPLGEREAKERELRLHNQLTSNGEVANGTCGDKQKSCLHYFAGS